MPAPSRDSCCHLCCWGELPPLQSSCSRLLVTWEVAAADERSGGVEVLSFFLAVGAEVEGVGAVVVDGAPAAVAISRAAAAGAVGDY